MYGNSELAFRAFSNQRIDSLVRLQQMGKTDPVAPIAEIVIARAKTDGLLLQRDRVLDRPDQQLAPAQVRKCVRVVAVERDYRLVFGNGLVEPALRAQHLTFGVMRGRAARR